MQEHSPADKANSLGVKAWGWVVFLFVCFGFLGFFWSTGELTNSGFLALSLKAGSRDKHAETWANVFRSTKIKVDDLDCLSLPSLSHIMYAANWKQESAISMVLNRFA